MVSCLLDHEVENEPGCGDGDRRQCSCLLDHEVENEPAVSNPRLGVVLGGDQSSRSLSPHSDPAGSPADVARTRAKIGAREAEHQAQSGNVHRPVTTRDDVRRGWAGRGEHEEIQTARPGRSEAPRIRAMPPTPWPIVGSDRASRSIVVHQQKV
jgi:hypothetical protein